ncbi:hypothetical protein GFS31_23580 [Leptolyngbya sp. BL0902]|nr:hypothetical protein [Leptolyngbya sp. BL0902]QQE65670.1 hypothetical protein GFS31_23580 [Leptolyngbya sp. BL0902]
MPFRGAEGGWTGLGDDMPAQVIAAGRSSLVGESPPLALGAAYRWRC